MIRLISFSFADRENSNAQNLTVQAIAGRLDPKRFETTLFALSSDVADSCQGSNVRVVRLPARGGAWRMALEALRPIYDVNFYVRLDPAQRLYERLATVTRRRIPRLLHATYRLGEELPADVLELWRNRIGASDLVISNCTAVQESLAELYGLQTRVIHNGIDLDRFRPRAASGERTPPLRVLFAGSLQERKRPDVVLDAARRFPEMSFTIVGSGELGVAVRARVRRESLANVEIVDAVPQADLASLLARGDIFFFPSLGEGHPQVLGQAAACGLPVIAKRSIRPDYVEDGRTGLLAGSDEDLLDCLERLGKDARLRDRMGKAGRERIRRHFSWGPLVEQWEEVLERATESRLR